MGREGEPWQSRRPRTQSKTRPLRWDGDADVHARSEGMLAAMMLQSPSSKLVELGTYVTKAYVLIFLYFDKVIQVELEVLHGGAMLLATEHTSDIVVLVERYSFFNIYKHNCMRCREDAVQMLAMPWEAPLLCFWPFFPITCCWMGDLTHDGFEGHAATRGVSILYIYNINHWPANKP